MRQRGRKSAASLNIVRLPVERSKVMAPPRKLSQEEADVFARTARLNPHLTEADADQLAAYAQAAAKAARLAKRDDGPSVKAWEITLRAMLLTARSLRITNQSKVHPEHAGRASESARPMTRMQQFLEKHGDDG